MIKIWGCLTKVLIPLLKKNKLGQKIVDCVFIGFASNNAACRFLVYKFKMHDIHVNIILESIDAEFRENIFSYKESQTSLSIKKAHNDEPSTSKL